jgi:hypothetical protein
MKQMFWKGQEPQGSVAFLPVYFTQFFASHMPAFALDIGFINWETFSHIPYRNSFENDMLKVLLRNWTFSKLYK